MKIYICKCFSTTSALFCEDCVFFFPRLDTFFNPETLLNTELKYSIEFASSMLSFTF